MNVQCQSWSIAVVRVVSRQEGWGDPNRIGNEHNPDMTSGSEGKHLCV